MNVLFVVQGEGRGHLTQAIAAARLLREAGHVVTEVLVGKSPGRRIPAYFYDRIAAPVATFDSPNFLPAARHCRPNLAASVAYNVTRLPLYVRSMRFLYRRIRDSKADMVINFYELLTGLTYFFFRPPVVQVCVGHQYLFLHREFRFPRVGRFSLALLKAFTRLTSLGAERRLALSFRAMPDDEANSVFVVPPLLRSEVLRTCPEQGDYLHGYLLNAGFSASVEAWHRVHPDRRLHFFRDSGGDEQVDDTLTFHSLDDAEFLRSLAGSRAYVSTAGFESVCEALYLGKPMLLVPVHIEQECNAYDAARQGAVLVADDFDLGALLQLKVSHRSDSDFVRWVDSCARCFLPQVEAALPVRLPRGMALA